MGDNTNNNNNNNNNTILAQAPYRNRWKQGFKICHIISTEFHENRTTYEKLLTEAYTGLHIHYRHSTPLISDTRKLSPMIHVLGSPSGHVAADKIVELLS
jgi:hypothetical protein